MRQPFDFESVDPLEMEHAKIHLLAEAARKREGCGLLAGGRYWPSDNTHESPEGNFRVDPELSRYLLEKFGAIEAVFHSHLEGGLKYPSKADMESQQKSELPWALFYVNGQMVAHVIWFGDQIPIAPLVGRPYVFGVYDCFTIMRDWYRLHRDYTMPNYPREESYWKNGQNLYLDLCADAGFIECPKPFEEDLQVGDVLLIPIRAKVPNHSIVYLGRGLGLHHPGGKLSVREPVDSKMSHVTHKMRCTRVA